MLVTKRQGTGADIMMLARISFARRLWESDIQAVLVSTVHDSIVVDVRYKKDLQALVTMFYQVFEDLPKNILRIFGYNWEVPLACECKFGPNMKDMEKMAPSIA